MFVAGGGGGGGGDEVTEAKGKDKDGVSSNQLISVSYRHERG